MKPSECDLPLETNQQSAISRGEALMAWERHVDAALHDDDKNALRSLFGELSTLVPSEKVSTEWLSVMSGWDARAKTG